MRLDCLVKLGESKGSLSEELCRVVIQTVGAKKLYRFEVRDVWQYWGKKIVVTFLSAAKRCI